MALDFETASDAVLGLLASAFRAEAEAVLGYEPRVEWPDQKRVDPATGEEAWARVAIRHVDARQTSLGEAGGRKFSRDGLVSVQLFVPKSQRGFTLLQKLGKVVVDALEGRHAGGVWVRQAVFREGGQADSHWQQANVAATFTYDVTK